MLSNIIHEFKNIQTNKSFAEVLQYLTEQKIFIFNPQDIKYEKICDSEIKKYYEEISKNLRKNIKEDILLENLQCEDNLRNDINLSQNTSNNNKDRKVNEDLEGKQKDCPKPGEEKIPNNDINNLDSNTDTNTDTDTDADIDTDNNENNQEIDREQINKTKELVKKIIPILCIILRTEKSKHISEILYYDDNNEFGKLINYNINKFNLKK